MKKGRMTRFLVFLSAILSLFAALITINAWFFPETGTFPLLKKFLGISKQSEKTHSEKQYTNFQKPKVQNGKSDLKISEKKTNNRETDSKRVKDEAAGSPFVFKLKPVKKLRIVGWWPFDEGQGHMVKDNGPNQFDGQILGDPEWVFLNNKTGLKFGNKSTSVRIPNIRLFSGDFTIEAFVYSFSPGNQNSVFFAGDSSFGNVGLYGAVQNGKVRFYIRRPDGQALNLWSKYPIVRQGQWNNIVWMKKGKTAAVFVNGEKVEMAVSRGGFSKYECPDEFQKYSFFYIGSKATSSESQYNGILGGVRILNYAFQ